MQFCLKSGISNKHTFPVNSFINCLVTKHVANTHTLDLDWEHTSHSSVSSLSICILHTCSSFWRSICLLLYSTIGVNGSRMHVSNLTFTLSIFFYLVLCKCHFHAYQTYFISFTMEMIMELIYFPRNSKGILLKRFIGAFNFFTGLRLFILKYCNSFFLLLCSVLFFLWRYLAILYTNKALGLSHSYQFTAMHDSWAREGGGVIWPGKVMGMIGGRTAEPDTAKTTKRDRLTKATKKGIYMYVIVNVCTYIMYVYAKICLNVWKLERYWPEFVTRLETTKTLIKTIYVYFAKNWQRIMFKGGFYFSLAGKTDSYKAIEHHYDKMKHCNNISI